MAAWFLFATDEPAGVASAPQLRDPRFCAFLLVSASQAFLLNLCIFWCTTTNSPLATTVTGQMKDILTTGLGLFCSAMFSSTLATWRASPSAWAAASRIPCWHSKAKARRTTSKGRPRASVGGREERERVEESRRWSLLDSFFPFLLWRDSVQKSEAINYHFCGTQGNGFCLGLPLLSLEKKKKRCFLFGGKKGRASVVETSATPPRACGRVLLAFGGRKKIKRMALRRGGKGERDGEGREMNGFWW